MAVLTLEIGTADRRIGGAVGEKTKATLFYKPRSVRVCYKIRRFDYISGF